MLYSFYFVFMGAAFKKLIIKSVPLSVYLDTLSLIIIGKAIPYVQDTPHTVWVLYYIYMGIVYIFQALIALLNACVKGYLRGFLIHILITIQLIAQVFLVICGLIYLQ